MRSGLSSTRNTLLNHRPMLQLVLEIDKIHLGFGSQTAGSTVGFMCHRVSQTLSAIVVQKSLLVLQEPDSTFRAQAKAGTSYITAPTIPPAESTINLARGDERGILCATCDDYELLACDSYWRRAWRHLHENGVRSRFYMDKIHRERHGHRIPSSLPLPWKQNAIAGPLTVIRASVVF